MAFLYAFDLLELDGQDLRREPLEVRKATLASILRKARHGVRLNEHLEHDCGLTVFQHACKMGLEGIVSKRLGSRLSLRPLTRDWLNRRSIDQKTPAFRTRVLLITEPELSLRDRRPEWLCGGFLCDHPGSLDGRVRNDAADCTDAAKCDADCNDQSNGELLAAALAHGERLHQASERTIQSSARAYCGSPPLAQL